jgi:tellurite resistance protein TerA
VAIDYTKRPKATEPAAGGGVSLSKVTLTKSTPTLSLTKQGSPGGQMRVNLNWTARPAGAAPAGGGGFLSKLKSAAGGAGGGAIDLDLGALYEFTDGLKGVVQALGDAFTASTRDGSKVLWLDGDDRSGASTGGENLFVDLSRSQQIKRVLVFAFIYEGTPNWAGANGVVTLYPASGPQVEVLLDEPASGQPTCAIAMLENVGGEIVVRREVKYIRGAQDKLDEAYGWGMDWRAGRK